MSKRAIRRHHRSRMIARTKRILKAYDWPEEYIKKAAERRANNFTVCSCYLCGNPRRKNRGEQRKTIQEIRACLDSVHSPYPDQDG